MHFAKCCRIDVMYLQILGQCQFILRHRHMVRNGAIDVGITPGDKRRSTRNALRVLSKRRFEAGAILCQLINVGRSYYGIAVAAHTISAQLIRKCQYDVRHNNISRQLSNDAGAILPAPDHNIADLAVNHTSKWRRRNMPQGTSPGRDSMAQSARHGSAFSEGNQYHQRAYCSHL